MSPFIILFILFFLYLSSKPKIRRYIERDGLYLSRTWTSFVNALFITLVVCSHGLILFKTNIRNFLPEKYTAYAISQFGQLIVTTFFFYSGFGIMSSILRKKEYHHKLLFPRFVQLSLYYVMAVLAYFVVYCLLQQKIHAAAFLHGLHNFQALGNPTWFIIMTLIIYLLTWFAFKIMGQKHPMGTIGLLTLMLLIVMPMVSLFKPIHWVNTLLCFPAGMLYYLKGAKIEQILKKTSIPSIVYAFILLGLGLFLHTSKLPAVIYMQNVGGILFAVGVTWFAGSFIRNTPSRFLIWLGGSGLFAVYMFHLLPTRIMTHYELNDGNPYLVWLIFIVSTGIFATVANAAYNRINKLIFSRL